MKKLLDIAFPGTRSITRVHGGDINETFLVNHNGQEFFVKYNNVSYAKTMFESEKHGLLTLSEVLPNNIPSVIDQINSDLGSILILEYINIGNSRNNNQSALGRLLAKLHKRSQSKYGLETDNYIGSLYQPNGFFDDFSTFYLESRILPQVKMGIDRKLLDQSYSKKTLKIESAIINEIPNELPTLIHGDLWNGNYLQSYKGKFYLIDPSISFSHREMDIAMSMLFGGFNPEFYNTYNESYKLEQGWQKRISIFQLYYILVHLNLFGLSYKPSVDRILDKWT